MWVFIEHCCKIVAFAPRLLPSPKNILTCQVERYVFLCLFKHPVVKGKWRHKEAKSRGELYPRRKDPGYPLDKSPDGPQSRS